MPGSTRPRWAGDTVVSTALPQINGPQTQCTWVFTATLPTASATTPVWGKLADLFDKKTLARSRS